MRSRRRRRRRTFVRPSVYSANAVPSHFFKIILPGTIHSQNMRIPKEFVRRFENELACDATIGVPDGLAWKMELEKSENEVCFCKGWQEFVKYYSISFGFFLVFKYEGNSQFSVVIFDVSGAEIYYPCKTNFEKQNSASERHRKRSSSFDHNGYNTRSKKHKLEDQEEIIDVDDDNVLNHGKSGNKDRSGQEIESSRNHEKEKDRSRQRRCSKMKNTLRRKQSAMEAAQNFKPENPSFTAIVRPSNLTCRYLDVPISFWRAYVGKLGPMKLQDSKGQKWAINFHRLHPGSIRIWKGWIGFARSNSVKEGDVCVFELIKRKNFVFQVTVFAS